jgi:hypothetical protein
MKKVLIILLIITANSANAQNNYSEIETIGEDTIKIVETLIQDSTKLYYHYRISFNNVNNKFDSNDLKPEMVEMFGTEIEFNEIVKQFVFISDENIEEVILIKKIINHELSFFKKTILN